MYLLGWSARVLTKMRLQAKLRQRLSPGDLQMSTTTSLHLAYETDLGTRIFGNRLQSYLRTCLYTMQTVSLISLLATLPSLNPSLLFAHPLAWLFVHLHELPCARQQGQMATSSNTVKTLNAHRFKLAEPLKALRRFISSTVTPRNTRGTS
jgi:hypothetical protein